MQQFNKQTQARATILDKAIKTCLGSVNNSMNEMRANYGELHSFNGFEALGSSELKYRKDIIKGTDFNRATCYRYFNAGILDIELALEPCTVPVSVLNALYKTDEKDRAKVWEISNQIKKGKHPKIKEVEKAKIKFEDLSTPPPEEDDNPKRIGRTHRKSRRTGNPTHPNKSRFGKKDTITNTDEVSKDGISPNMSKQPKTEMPEEIAFKRIKKWNNPGSLKSVIKILKGKSRVYKACKDIEEKLSTNEQVRLLKKLEDLINN